MNTAQNLLRPHQVAEMSDEKKNLEKAIASPHVREKGEAVQALRRISKQLETQTPTSFNGKELDNAVRREAQLREELLAGMPSQEEMRKSPPGAVGKHMEWEKRNKAKLQEWKNLKLRINVGTSDPDIANFERFRPKNSTLNMDNAVVSGTQYFMPETTSPTTTFNDDELATLRELAPELAAKVAMLSNAQRAEVKAIVTKAPKRGPKGMSAERRAQISADMKARHAAKKAAKATAEAPAVPTTEHVTE